MQWQPVSHMDVSCNRSLTFLDLMNNPLTTLYLAQGQEIPKIWIPDETEIIIKDSSSQ